MDCDSPNEYKEPQTPLTITFKIPEFALNDLCSRFIINIPEGEERENPIRLFFQIELAHWHYLDFFCEKYAHIQTVGIREFSHQIFLHCPTLKEKSDQVDHILEQWRNYKMQVPTFGAILLDNSLHNVLMVQGFWTKATWGFPKGKVNQDEEPIACAVREVFEETGYNIGAKIRPKEYIEANVRGQTVRLYIIRDVPLKTKFQPQTRREIKNVRWFRLDQLPVTRKDTNCKAQIDLTPNSFFTAIPFVKHIKKWIQSFSQNNRIPDPITVRAKTSAANDFIPESWKNFSVDIDYIFGF